MISRTLALAAVALALLGSASARATPLGLGALLLDVPDITVMLADVEYDYDATLGVGTFDATGWATTIDLGSGPDWLDGPGAFQLTAFVDATGALLGSMPSTLSIGGTYAAAGFLSGLLLAVDLTAFGFPAGPGDPLEFLGDVTGGDAAASFGDRAGMLLFDAGFPGPSGFTTAHWDNLSGGTPGTGAAFGDVKALIPEPSAATLFAVGASVAAALARRRRRGGA